MKLPEKLEFGKATGARDVDGKKHDYYWHYRVVSTNLPDVSIWKEMHCEAWTQIWNKFWRVYIGDDWYAKIDGQCVRICQDDLRHCKEAVRKLFDQLKAHECDFSDCAECEKHNKCLAEWWYWRGAQQCNHDCGDCGGTTGCNERERYKEWEAQF